MRIGVMQGRLVPPENGRFQCFPQAWRDEFPRAKDAGVDYIEWIVDSVPGNPIFTIEGRDEMQELQAKYEIDIPAICGDWFMEHPLWEDFLEWKRMLRRLMVLAYDINIDRIIIPFVDNSRIRNADDVELVVDALEFTHDDVELHVETDLPPLFLSTLVNRLPGHIYANYDSGNSSGMGYVASEEFAAYGNRIGSIHIKDRYRHLDGTVTTQPLGQGSADFDDVFRCIHSISYDGDLTLQVARGESGGEVAWIRKQAEFVRRGFYGS